MEIQIYVTNFIIFKGPHGKAVPKIFFIVMCMQLALSGLFLFFVFVSEKRIASGLFPNKYYSTALRSDTPFRYDLSVCVRMPVI